MTGDARQGRTGDYDAVQIADLVDLTAELNATSSERVCGRCGEERLQCIVLASRHQQMSSLNVSA